MLHAILLSSFIFLMSLSNPDIRTIDSLEPFERELEHVKPDTLILLDVGGTLLAHRNAALHTAHKEWKLEWFKKNYPNLSAKEKLAVTKVIQEDPENWHLLDKKWPSLIASAQNKGNKVVILTKTTIDPSLTDLRHERLKVHGIDLKDDLPNLKDGSSFYYSNGMIETNSSLKGPVLEEIFLQLGWTPKQILFIDNRRVQIESVSNTCASLGISCIAFEYTAILKDAPLLDEAVADYQLHALVEEHHLPSEEEARKNLGR